MFNNCRRNKSHTPAGSTVPSRPQLPTTHSFPRGISSLRFRAPLPLPSAEPQSLQIPGPPPSIGSETSPLLPKSISISLSQTGRVVRREAHSPSPYTSPMFSWGSPHILPEFCSLTPIIRPGLCLLLHIHTIFSLYSITPIFHLDSFPSQIRCKPLSPPQRILSTPLPFREPSLNTPHTPLPIFWDSPGPEPLPQSSPPRPPTPRRPCPSTCILQPCSVTSGPSWSLVLFQS